MKIFGGIKNRILNSIFPDNIKCIFCDEELPSPTPFDTCDKCMELLPFLEKDFCPRCGGKLEEDQIGVCFNCKKNNFDFSYARSVFVYDDFIRPIVHKFKFGSGKYLAKPLANFMAEKLKSLDWNIDIITYVPMFKKREKQRGFNQARELANEIGKILNIPVQDIFEKKVDTHEQARLNSMSRRKNLKDAFKVIGRNLKDKTILIVDDIYTTGATCSELSSIIKDRCQETFVLTLAHTQLDEKDV